MWKAQSLINLETTKHLLASPKEQPEPLRLSILHLQIPTKDQCMDKGEENVTQSCWEEPESSMRKGSPPTRLNRDQAGMHAEVAERTTT